MWVLFPGSATNCYVNSLNDQLTILLLSRTQSIYKMRM